MVKNPTFGRWPDAEVEGWAYSGYPGGNVFDGVADPRAEEDFERVLEGKPAAARPETNRKVVLHACRATAGAAGKSDVYERPFTSEEAASLLAAAGIEHEGVVQTYVADWAAMADPVTLRGPLKGQCVVASLRTEDGKALRQAHLYFVYDRERRGWRLAKAAVEVPV